MDIDITFLPSGSPERLLILVRSDEVELRPELPTWPAHPMSSFPAPSCQTSPAMLDTGRGILVFYLLSVEALLVLHLSIPTIIICVIAIAICGSESVIQVRLGVFRLLEGFMIVPAL